MDLKDPKKCRAYVHNLEYLIEKWTEILDKLRLDPKNVDFIKSKEAMIKEWNDEADGIINKYPENFL